MRSRPKWRNWQTRRTQNPVPSGECGFDSHLRHCSRARSALGTIVAVPEDTDRFVRFRTAVLDEPELEQRLRALADWATFAASAIAEAGTRGIELTTDELKAERRRAQLGWLTRWA